MMNGAATVRSASIDDAAAIADIYNHYVLTSIATFDTEPLGVGDVGSRIAEAAGRYPWLVAELNDRLVGYCYASCWRPRNAYRYSVETTIYLRDGFTGGGVGFALYRSLLDDLRRDGFRNRHRRYRTAERCECRAARAARLSQGSPFRARRSQTRPGERCRLLAGDALSDAIHARPTGSGVARMSR